MRLLLIDCHAVSRRGGELLLQRLFPEAEIASAASLPDRANTVGSNSMAPDLILLVTHFPYLPTDPSSLARVCETHSVLILSFGGERNEGPDAVTMGARGYVTGETNPDSLPQIVQLILSGELYLPTTTTLSPPDLLLESAPLLTSRQEQVLNGLMGGKSNKKIARENGITEATVKAHIRALMDKFRVRNRTELAIRMLRRKTFQPAGLPAPSEEASGKST